MKESDAYRLIASGLYPPGVSELDYVELLKAGRRNNRLPTDTQNRGQYLSDLSDNWSYWGSGSHDSKPMSTVPFPVLREKYKASPIDKLIVMRRQMQIRRVANRCIVPGRQVGFRVVHERHADPQFTPSPETLERCALMERLICNVSRDVCKDVKQFSSMVIKEELVIDRKAMVRFLDEDTKRPVAYAPLDAATIMPRISVLWPFMQKKGMANPGDIEKAASMLSQELRAAGIRDAGGKEIDITKCSWIQVVEDQIKGAWTKEEMSIDIVNRDVEIDQILYGKSALEQSLELTDLFINALMYNMNIFTPNFPEGFISIMGAYDKQGIEGFRRTILMQTNQSGSQRIPVVPGDDPTFKAEFVKLRDTPKDALFAELLRIVIALKTACYGMHPSEINFSPDGGGQTAMINEEDEGAAQEAATADGFNSSLDNLAGWWTEALIRAYFDDLVVIWDGLSTDNELGRVDLNVKKLEAYATLSETRGTENAFTLEIPSDPSEWDLTKMPLNANLVQLANIKFQAQQMKLQAQAQSGMPEVDPNADYGTEDGANWHEAGTGPQQDFGEEPDAPPWFMAGQKDSKGDIIKPGKAKSSQKPKPVGKSLKYLNIVLEDDEVAEDADV